MVYVSNDSWRVHNNYLLQKLHKCASVNSLVMLEAFLYFEGSSLILAPNLRQGKCFFCGLVCCTGSATYLSGRHLKKSRKLDLNWKFYAPKRILYAQRRKVFINITKSIPKAPNISKCRPSKYGVVVQEKFQDRSLYSHWVIWCKSVHAVWLIAGWNALGLFTTEAFLPPNNIFFSHAVQL